MNRAIAVAIALAVSLGASQLWAAGQDPPADGSPPLGITGGDANMGYVGQVFLEFRDIPNGPFQLELPAARSLRVAARLRGESLAPFGLELQLLSADFVCGDPVPAGAEGVCVVTTVCVLNKQGKELCESEPLLDFDAPPESFQALIEALLVPRIKLAYGIVDPSTVLATSKVAEFVKGRVVIGADGVKHAYVAQDVAISAD